jgi:hypothetical protein
LRLEEIPLLSRRFIGKYPWVFNFGIQDNLYFRVRGGEEQPEEGAWWFNESPLVLRGDLFRMSPMTLLAGTCVGLLHFLQILDIVLIDEKVRPTFPCQANEIPVDVFNPPLHRLAIHQFHDNERLGLN